MITFEKVATSLRGGGGTAPVWNLELFRYLRGVLLGWGWDKVSFYRVARGGACFIGCIISMLIVRERSDIGFRW